MFEENKKTIDFNNSDKTINIYANKVFFVDKNKNKKSLLRKCNTNNIDKIQKEKEYIIGIYCQNNEIDMKLIDKLCYPILKNIKIIYVALLDDQRLDYEIIKWLGNMNILSLLMNSNHKKECISLEYTLNWINKIDLIIYIWDGKDSNIFNKIELSKEKIYYSFEINN